MHSLFSDITPDPQPLAVSEFAVGDRVQYNGEGGRQATFTGTVAKVDGEIVSVCEDGAPLSVRACGHQRLFTRIERPHLWQGECFGCHIPLTPLTACRYDGFETHTPYLCLSCWEAETVDDNKHLVKTQEAALATSRAWMHERHPDDPRWQEPTSVEEA